MAFLLFSLRRGLDTQTWHTPNSLGSLKVSSEIRPVCNQTSCRALFKSPKPALVAPSWATSRRSQPLANIGNESRTISRRRRRRRFRTTAEPSLPRTLRASLVRPDRLLKAWMRSSPTRPTTPSTRTCLIWEPDKLPSPPKDRPGRAAS